MFISKGNATQSTAKAFCKTVSLIKSADPQDERYVLGVVLEPEVVDAQNDMYSEEEVRKAAHRTDKTNKRINTRGLKYKALFIDCDELNMPLKREQSLQFFLENRR